MHVHSKNQNKKKIDAKKRIAIEAIRKERVIFLMKKIVSILNPNQI